MRRKVKYTTASELRAAMFSLLTVKRLQAIANDLGVFKTEGLNQAELRQKLQRSRAYSTDIALYFMTLRELQALAKQLHLPLRPRVKADLIRALEDHVVSLRSPASRKTTRKSAAPNALGGGATPEPPPPPKPPSEDFRSLDLKVWAECPKCSSPVKKVNLERHLREVHGDRPGAILSAVCKPEKAPHTKNITKQDILEAIGYEWCVDYMRGVLTHTAGKGMSDTEIVDAFLGKKGRNLQTLLRELTDQECVAVADYMEIPLPLSGASQLQRLVEALRSVSDYESCTLLIKTKVKKKYRKTKPTSKKKKTKKSRQISSGKSMDIFNRGMVVSGGAYGLGKNRRH